MDSKVAIVTGSTSGIGLAIATRLARAGYSVVINSRKTSPLDDSFLTLFPKSVYIAADVSLAEDAEKLIHETVEKFGRIDVLVNNAGVTRVIPYNDLSAVTGEVWNDILGTNIVGTWQMIVAALPHLKATQGSIINISSRAATRPIGSSIPYAVSKAGIEHMTRFLAKILGPDIRVNALAPGLIETPWTQNDSYFDAVKNMYATSAPLRRTGTPEDIAEAAMLLLNSSFITGAVIPVDGGANLV